MHSQKDFRDSWFDKRLQLRITTDAARAARY